VLGVPGVGIYDDSSADVVSVASPSEVSSSVSVEGSEVLVAVTGVFVATFTTIAGVGVAVVVNQSHDIAVKVRIRRNRERRYTFFLVVMWMSSI
jgi:hypothetical protein